MPSRSKHSVQQAPNPQPASAHSATLQCSPTRDGDSHSSSLRSKLVLSLALVLAAFTVVNELVRRRVIVPEFANLERRAAIKDTERVVSAIDAEINFLAEIAEQDHDLIALALKLPSSRGGADTEELPQRNRIDFSGVLCENGDWRSMRAPAEPSAKLVEALRKSRLRSANGIHRGIIGSEGQAHLVASVPFPSDPADRYVVVRQFDDRLMAEVRKLTSVEFSLDVVDLPSTQTQIDDQSAQELLIHTPLESLGGSPCELTIRLPREVMMRSSVTNGFARYLSLCGSCASLLVLLLLLQRIVIGRIEAIREHTEQIAQTGILSDASVPVLRDAGRDEIGQLASAFDRMKGRLADAQRKMSDSSHAAGMSLVADTVIHNVGNVLTNVNSLLETATSRVDSLRIQPLRKLAERLERGETDEAFQNAMPSYLKRLSESLGDDRDELALLLETLESNIQHIHLVIRDQKRHASQSPKPIEVLIRPLIEEAVRCCQARLDQEQVRVELTGDPQAKASTDQLLILQIMINLISNAGNAMLDVKNKESELAIEWVNSSGDLEIRFRDNGCGMDAITLESIFDAHFTTRQSGSGLGLHFCAIALRRVGGTIRAHSDGPGLGAEFVITLPIKITSRDANPASPALTALSSSESRS